MFVHNLKTMLKVLMKNKALIFWTLAFPLILGTFFKMAFSNIEKSEKLEVFDIAVINNSYYQNDEYYQKAFKSLDNLFNVFEVDLKKAEVMLLKNEIEGYVLLSDNPEVVVKENDINETILKYVTDSLVQSKAVMGYITQNFDSSSLYENLQAFLNNEYDLNIQDISNSNLSYTMIEYYTLIAMACLYGGILGMYIISFMLPNMSAIGKRIGICPASKKTLILSGVVASYIIELIALIILFLYTILVLKVDFGTKIPEILLLSFLGSFAGLSLGIFIGSVFKTSYDNKVGINLSFTMAGCFFSGMMGITMKYIIDKNVPFINIINPASMITDGFYALYYYSSLDRYYFNVFSLVIFSGLVLLISFMALRRQKYDSI